MDLIITDSTAVAEVDGPQLGVVVIPDEDGDVDPRLQIGGPSGYRTVGPESEIVSGFTRLLAIPEGDYRLSVTTFGVNAEPLPHENFRTGIRGQMSTRALLREDDEHPDPYTDTISFSYDGLGAYFLEVDGFRSDTQYLVTFERLDEPGVPALPPVPEADDWIYLAPDSHSVILGGSGKVYGTVAPQLFVTPLLLGQGRIAFDASFNRGGDGIWLGAYSTETYAKVVGSTVFLSDTDTVWEIPVGPVGVAIGFNDGSATLRVDLDANAVTIGSAVLDDSYTLLSDLDLVPMPEFETDREMAGTLLLSEDASVVVGGHMEIFGTAGAETVLPLHNTSAVLDASFNRGGDTIAFNLFVGALEISTSDSSIFLHGDLDIEIPLGPAGLTVSRGPTFYSDPVSALLFLDTDLGVVLAGEQVITGTPMPLTFA